MRAIAILSVVVGAFIVMGCAIVAPVVPPVAGLYTSIEAPIDIDNDQTQLGTKRGESSSQSLLGLFAWGDASTRTAATNGGISTIRHADYEYFNVLGIYQRFTLVVYGD